MSTSRAEYAAALAALSAEQRPDYLTAHSNLPGPRANLTLLDAAADTLPRAAALALADSTDEYLACCGVATLGRLILENPDDRDLVDLLTLRCADGRWRVREACAIAAQRIGDGDPARLRDLVAAWVADPHPLVVRAGIAAICEPRLLADPDTAAAALAACRRATEHLLATPPERRRDADVRTLRQGLGYCWSVAVAASPEPGLAAFLALGSDDPDVAWVVRENRKKQRLARLLG
nr:HEAT repeat domain-containing protein [Propionicimonas sp.]